MDASPDRVVAIDYVTLTHVNRGRCLIEIHEREDGPWLVVASDLPGHLGPRVRQGARMVAAVVHRDLVPTGRDWQLFEHTRGITYQVDFAEAFGGWFNRPTFTPLDAAVLAGLLGH